MTSNSNLLNSAKKLTLCRILLMVEGLGKYKHIQAEKCPGTRSSLVSEVLVSRRSI